ncbi:MAG: hypothetical protein EBZ89_13265 [Chloroflexi bacterium]|nr:hypothetical protein [Chloroflexota bacterium]
MSNLTEDSIVLLNAGTTPVGFGAIGPVGIKPVAVQRATPVPTNPFHYFETKFRPRSLVTAEPLPMTSAPSPRVVDTWIPAIIVAGFILRLIRITGLGDLEFDEIVSLRYAVLAPAALISQLAGALFEHPPGYYLAIGAWVRLAEAGGIGTTDGVVLRSLSVVIGTLKYAHHIPTLTPGCARNKGNMSNLTEDSIVLAR